MSQAKSTRLGEDTSGPLSKRFVPALAALLLLWSGSARAARGAYVIGDNGGGPTATLLSEPAAGSTALATLQSGSPITISNYPTNGYYKARTASGQIGWIATTAVGSAPPAAPPPPQQPPQEIPPPPSTPAATPMETPTAAPMAAPGAPAASEEPENETIPYQDVEPEAGAEIEREATQPKGPRLPWEVRLFAGDQFLNTSISFSQIGVSLYSSMAYFGLQAGLPMTDRIFLLLRLEYLTNSSSAAGYQFSLSATPLMTGISYLFTDPGSSIRLRGSLLMGVALATTLDATATSEPAPNITELETQAFTEMLKADLDIPVTRSFTLYGELGYRFLDSSSIGPSEIVNGSSIFQQNGSTTVIQLNLSGFFVGGGVAFYL